MKSYRNIFPAFLYVVIFNLLFYYSAKANGPDKFQTTQEEINSRENYIKSASKIFNINPRILAITIFTERYLNYTFIDKELDFLLLDFGINASVGFAQVKIKTAEWIEKQLNTKTEEGYLGKVIPQNLPISKDVSELKEKLKSDSLNILYAAAYISIFIKMWRNHGKKIHDNISVLATLYSHGFMSPEDFKVNSFGEKAFEFYNTKDILKKF